jgi:hypothetical protein
MYCANEIENEKMESERDRITDRHQSIKLEREREREREKEKEKGVINTF